MKSYRNTIFVLLSLFVVVGVHADNADVLSIDDLKLMVQQLNVEIEELTENLKSAEINNKAYKKELELWKKETLFNINRQNYTAIALAALLVIFGGLSFLGVRRWIRQNAERIAQNVFVERVSNIVGINAEYLKEILEHQRIISQSKSKRITVISSVKNSENEAFLRDFFRILGFKNIRFAAINESDSLRGMDIILFNNEDSKLEESDILSIIGQFEKWRDLQFLYFGSMHLERTQDLPQLLSANTRMTLYHRLTEVLQYSRILELIESDTNKSL